jgi:hypothetical protein
MDDDDLLLWLAGGLGAAALVAGAILYARKNGMLQTLPGLASLAASAARTDATQVVLPDLASAAFPGVSPGAAVVVPRGFSPSDPLHVIVYFHGWNNCCANVVANQDGTCHVGGPRRNASHLVAQMEAAGSRAILVVPELQPEVESGAAGKLGQAGGLKALLDELLSGVLVPLFGVARDSTAIRRLSIQTHSGGYAAAAAAIRNGGVSSILREVVLHDSLYGNVDVFNGWVRDHAAGFGVPGLDGFRFANVYTDGGGTRANARAQAQQLADLGLAGAMADLVSGAELASVPAAITFKRTGYSHVEMTRHYPGLWFAPVG